MNKGLWVFYGLMLVGLLISANQHGMPKTGKNNFWVTVLSLCLELPLIWWALNWKLY